MKVLCVYSHAGPSFVRSGWGRVFASCGHTFRFWDMSREPAFDVFTEFEPDLFIGTSYDLDRATFKCIATRPEMKVILYGSAWGPLVDNIDRERYPIVLVTEQEKRVVEELKKASGKPDFVFIHAHGDWLEGTMSGWRNTGVKPVGILNGFDAILYANPRFRPELECDIGYVGGIWGFKARNLDRYLIPLLRDINLRCKVFGNQPWPVANYLGLCLDETNRDLFVSATVCPNVSEPHSTDLGFDLVERPLKILGVGGFCVSDYVAEARDLFDEQQLLMFKSPQDFMDAVYYHVKHPGERESYIREGQKEVLRKHTYYDRVATMLAYLGLHNEVETVTDKKIEYLNYTKDTVGGFKNSLPNLATVVERKETIREYWTRLGFVRQHHD